jgi:alpha-L-rhamnosidase
MAKTSYPGYGYFIDRGETTFPEVWEIEHPNCAQIHTSYAGISAWFIKGLAGINPGCPGYRQIRIEPNVVDNLNHASAGMETPFGLVESGWFKGDDRITYTISVPVGAEAELVLAANTVSGYEGVPLNSLAGVKSIRKEGEMIHINVMSGYYIFETK